VRAASDASRPAIAARAEPVAELGTTFAAVVLRWEPDAGAAERQLLDRLRRRIERLCAAGMHIAVLSEFGSETAEQQLAATADGPGRLLLVPTDGGRTCPVGPHRSSPIPSQPPAASLMTHILDLLAGEGVGPGLVLVIGSEFGPGGRDAALLVPQLARATVVSVGAEPTGVPAAVRHAGGGAASRLGLLDEQLRRRACRRVPGIDADPGWIVRETGADPRRHRVTETLFTLGAGGLATRGAVEEPVAGSIPLVLASGTFTGSGSQQHLLPGPSWTRLEVDPAPVEDVRTLDLRTGVLLREEARPVGRPLRSLRFASITRPGVMALRAESDAGRLRAGSVLTVPDKPTAARSAATGRRGDVRWARTGDGPGIAAVATQRSGLTGGLRTVERLAAYVVDRRRPPRLSRADATLRSATAAGYERLLAEHRSAWAARWDRVSVGIPDDPDAELAIRFALFQLWCNTADLDELAVGARGLSGPGYAGHVFWDADAFVLPALVTLDPAAAAAMVRYRLQRLPAARTNARACGYSGARFPWESAATGDDVTPQSGFLGGRPTQILTGRYEEHITADVAWSAVHAAEWTGQAILPSWSGFPLLIDTARYWAARSHHGPDGRMHIDDVIGPDEYHEHVSDNAFTNVMARWNLRAAADAAASVPALATERQHWCQIAAGLVDGYDPVSQRYEQFAGYFDLEPLVVADYAAPPVAVDVLLGRERVAASQLIKQPDVLMLHHLVPDETAPLSLAANLDYYNPRTAHGSSLSPAVTASLLARAGRPDEALEMLRLALAIDLDDLTAATAAGLHLANLGGIWQSVLSGFAGVRARGSVLRVDPQLPAAWSRLNLRFHALGRRVQLGITPESVRVIVDGPTQVQVMGAVDQKARPVDGEATFSLKGRSAR
jgi:trehalose/maltose hydrolase-like predicted phosphorylase